MNTRNENAAMKNSVVADTTFQSLHNIIERYGDAGFWNTAYSTLIKFQYGGCASSTNYPMSSALASSVLALRTTAGMFAILEASLEEIDRHASEKRQRENLDAQKAFQEELIQQLMPLITEVNEAKRFFDDEFDELSLAEINDVLLQVFLSVYEEKADELSDLDKHVEYSLLRGLDNIMQVREPRKQYLRVFQAVGDFVYGNIFGISFVTGIATLLALIPGVNIVMLAMLVSAAIVGLLYGSLKVLRNLFSDKKHDLRRKLLIEQQQEFEKSLRLLVALDYAQHIGVNQVKKDDGENLLVEDFEKLELINDPKREWLFRIGFKLLYIAAISAVVGASSVITLNTFIKSASTLAGSSLGLAGVALTVIPIVSIIVTFAFYSFKVLMGMIDGIKQEKNLIQHVNEHLEAQNESAKRNGMLRDLIQLDESDLLVEFVGMFLNVNDAEEEANAAMFLHLIEGIIGARKSEAKTTENFYGYLAYALTDALDEEDALSLVNQLIELLEEEAESFADLELLEKFVKQNRVFRKNDDGTLDHRGNLKRVLEFVKQSYKHVLNVTIPIVIGLAIGLLFATGPVFPIVASVFAVLLLGVYVLNKVLEHRHNKRMVSYEKTLALVETRDKTVEYALKADKSLGDYGRFFAEKNPPLEEENSFSISFEVV